MTRHLAIAALAGVLALAAPPALAKSQLQISVERNLAEYGFRDVDVRSLSTAQLAAIRHIAHGQGSEGNKRALIRSTLGGRDTLRSLFGLRR